MEVLTIEHSAFQQLISKIDAMDEFIRKVKLEQHSAQRIHPEKVSVATPFKPA